jgi:hypothetical protein
MTWLTYLLGVALMAPPTKWTVIVGGTPADTSVYANGFFPKAI